MTKDQLTLALQQEFAKRREDNLRLYQQRTEEACQRCPGLRELLDTRHMAVVNGVRTSLLTRVKDPKANAELPSAMARLNQKIAAALEKGGLGKDYLQPIYQCPECRDEGYVYQPSRRMCGCMARELNQRMLIELGLGNDHQTFEAFDETLFSDEPDAQGASQRQLVNLARIYCEAYADHFPQVDPPNILLTGRSGLGKTFLMRAIAHRVADRGGAPTYTSAYKLLEVARQSYIENNSALMSAFLTAPLLLIDDLGTEPVMQNITVTQMFILINERQNAGLHTVVSTNLSLSALKEHYNERIASRLLDASCWRRLTLIGDDVRMRLKRS